MSQAEGNLTSELSQPDVSAGVPPPDRDPPQPRQRTHAGWFWRHKVTTVCLISLAAALVVRLAWQQSVERRLASLAHTHPEAAMEPEELALPPLPDAQNAALIVAAAAAKEVDSAPSSVLYDYPSYPPMSPEWDRQAAQSEVDNAAVFAIARTLRDRPQARVYPQFTRPYHRTLLTQTPLTGGFNVLRYTLPDGALHQHLLGNDREAIERLRDMLQLARVHRSGESLLPQLIATGLDAIAAERTLLIAPALKVQDPAVRASAEALLVELLNDVWHIDAFVRAAQFERAVLIDSAREASHNAWMLKPIAGEAEVLATEHAAAMIRALRSGDGVTAAAILAQRRPVQRRESWPGSTVLALGRKIEKAGPPYHEWFYDGKRTVEHFYRARGERRMAAVSLAVRLFVHDHGHWPADLGQLVPKYLPAVPADPFRTDGGPIGYTTAPRLPDGSDRPMAFYRAGPTEAGAIDVEPMYGWNPAPSQRQPQFVQYRDLSRWSPAARRYDVNRAAEQAAQAAEATATIGAIMADVGGGVAVCFRQTRPAPPPPPEDDTSPGN